MGKRGKGRENGTSSSSGFRTSLTLREEASGKKQSHNSKALLKHKHFQNLAEWAAGLGQGESKDEPSIGCLGAFFGRRYAEFGESLGIPPDPSLFSCQRCETILQPGSNCTIRIEKNRAKSKRQSKTKTPTQNNVVYTCHFCLHRNLKRGTTKGYMKNLTPAKPRSSKPKSITSKKKIKSNSVKPDTTDKENFSKIITGKANEENLSNVITDKAAEVPAPAPAPVISNICSSLTDTPTSSLAESGAKLLDSKRRKRKKPGVKGSTEETLVNSAPAEREKDNSTLKRRKKSWITLKDIAESEKHDRNQRFTNFSIPFNL